jgi:c-di-GMP-related signal transduction protein
LQSLGVDETLLALRSTLRNKQGKTHPAGFSIASPVQAGKIYADIASRPLAEHCLDEQAANALLDWPTEDVLHAYRQSGIQPDQQAMRDLLKAIDSDASMDDIEYWLGQDPVLVYRFLRYANSAALGLSREIDALRQGLMVLGLSHTKKWLLDLFPHAAHDLNLQPVRKRMVLRAQFMADLLDAGESVALRRELYLSGLLCQIDQLVAEPLAGVLSSIPLPCRVKDAIAGKTGPYWPILEVAMAIESPQLDITFERCQQHSFDLEEVNLVLLRTLATLK